MCRALDEATPYTLPQTREPIAFRGSARDGILGTSCKFPFVVSGAKLGPVIGAPGTSTSPLADFRTMCHRPKFPDSDGTANILASLACRLSFGRWTSFGFLIMGMQPVYISRLNSRWKDNVGSASSAITALSRRSSSNPSSALTTLTNLLAQPPGCPLPPRTLPLPPSPPCHLPTPTHV